MSARGTKRVENGTHRVGHGKRSGRTDQKTKGPASAATDPDHGSTIPEEETAMNRPNDATRPADPASDDKLTPAEIAANTFEPWKLTKGSPLPPTNEEFTKLGEQYMPIVRMGFMLMHQPKEGIVALFQAHGQYATELADDFKSAEDWFSSFAELMGAARARMIVAAAAHLESGRAA